jgi:hypothetical protein
MVRIGQEVAFSFGFKDNTANEGHFGREKVSDRDATAEGLWRKEKANLSLRSR